MYFSLFKVDLHCTSSTFVSAVRCGQRIGSARKLCGLQTTSALLSPCLLPAKKWLPGIKVEICNADMHSKNRIPFWMGCIRQKLPKDVFSWSIFYSDYLCPCKYNYCESKGWILQEELSKSPNSAKLLKHADVELKTGKMTCHQRLKTNGLVQPSQMLCREDKQPFWHIRGCFLSETDGETSCVCHRKQVLIVI